MRTTRTHYEVLGLPRDATLVQIRRRYKQLVRKYHPDVAADKQTAHRLFLQIKDAYESLSDPIRRRAYDATLTTGRPGPPAGPYRTTTAPGATRAPGGGPLPIVKHLKDARWSFIQRRFNEAADHCRAVLEIDPRNAAAFVILGDAFRAQGKTNSAIRYYSYAVQYNPADRDTGRKLDRLIGKRIEWTARRGPGISAAQASMMTINLVWWGIGIFLLLLTWVHPGAPIPWLRYYIPQIQHWSWNLVGLVAASSAVIGMLLSVNGFLSNPDEELVYESQGGGWAVIPTGLILMGASVIFFVGAAGLYLVLGLLQGSLSRSVLVVFGAVAGIVVLASLLYVPAARCEVLLFGGNVSFLAMLFGWYAGSLVKPLSSL